MLVVPAVAITAKGFLPAARSARTAALNVSMSMQKFVSEGIFRTWSARKPMICKPLAMEEWVWSET